MFSLSFLPYQTLNILIHVYHNPPPLEYIIALNDKGGKVSCVVNLLLPKGFIFWIVFPFHHAMMIDA